MDHTPLYKASAGRPVLVEVPPMRFLMIEGVGGVGDAHFSAAMSALYTLAYQVKFAAKKRLGLAYKVAPSEGLYWDPNGDLSDEPSAHATAAWRLMISIPDEIDAEFVDDVRQAAIAKKGLPFLADVHVRTYSEGAAVQVLHVGPYAAETPTVESLRAFARAAGLETTGPHHEIYLSDPSKTAAEKLKTILRHPVRRNR